MTDLGHKMIGTMGPALVCLLLGAGTASAAWEPASQVDNQGANASTSWNYPGIADGANGLSTAYFTQSTSTNGITSNGGYAIRRGASDSVWSGPQSLSFPKGQTVGAQNPLTAAADAQGNSLSVSEQIAGGVPGIDANAWPASASGPGNYSLLMSTSPAAGGVTDPQVAFDSNGTGYAVAGAGQGASSDEPILISTYSPSAGAWSAPAPISVQVTSAGTGTCPGGAPANRVCGQEPRLAVSPDGTVVVVYLKTFGGQIPGTTQEELFAVRTPAGAGGAPGSFIKEVQITQSGDQVPIAPVPGASPSTTPPNFDATIDGSDTATIVDAESQSGLNDQILATRWPGGNVAPQGATEGQPGGVLISSGEPAPPASEPRLASAPAGDVTAMWTESSPNPTVQSLVASELTGVKWTQPQTLSSSTDSPSNPGGYTVNTPPFWLAEDGAGNAYAVWTSNGALQGATRSPAKNWNDAVTISGVSSTVPGTARLATGLTGQADALVVSGNGTRNALYATRFTAPVTPPSSQPGTPAPGPPAIPPGQKPKPLVPCYARPALRIFAGRSHASTKHIVVVGRASEHKCRFPDAATKRANRVVRVYVEIYRPAPLGKCRFLRPNGHLTATIPCTRPVKYTARGTRVWTLRLSLHVPAIAGGYLVRAWAVDGFGRMSVRGPASVTHLKVAGQKKPKRKHPH